MMRCAGDVLLTRDDRTLIRCGTCGFIHVHPPYDPAQLEAFYRNEFGESTPSASWADKVWNVQRMKPGGRVLDVGCWEGAQLELFLKAGDWECTGTELNARAAEVARRKGITVHQVSLEEFVRQFHGQVWDVINLAYVLEHIPDPAGLLRQLRSFLAPGGLLVVEVPNEFSPMQRAYLKARGIEPYWVALPVHLNYFQPETLEAIATASGYDIVHRESTFPMELFLLMGEDYLGRPDVGRACFGRATQMEAHLRAYDPAALSRMYSKLYEAGIGRALILYLRPAAGQP